MTRIRRRPLGITRLGLALSVGLLASPAAALAASPSASIAETDGSGTTISLEQPATRVVCLTGMCTDTLFLLGIEPVALSDQLHVNPAYWGDAGAAFPIIGGSFFEPALEDIAAARPDLVIGLGGVHEGIREGLATIAPLFIVNPEGLDGMLEQAAQLGRLLGREADVTAAGQALLDRIEQDCGSLQERRSALAVFGSDVNIGVDVARTPMIDALSRCADYPFTFDGESHEFPSFSLEQLLELDPDVLFVETIGFGAEPPEALTSQLADHPIWSELTAIKNGDVREVSFEVWGTTRGIHGTGLVLDEALPVLYPEQFPAAQP